MELFGIFWNLLRIFWILFGFFLNLLECFGIFWESFWNFLESFGIFEQLGWPRTRKFLTVTLQFLEYLGRLRFREYLEPSMFYGQDSGAKIESATPC